MDAQEQYMMQTWLESLRAKLAAGAVAEVITELDIALGRIKEDRDGSPSNDGRDDPELGGEDERSDQSSYGALEEPAGSDGNSGGNPPEADPCSDSESGRGADIRQSD